MTPWDATVQFVTKRFMHIESEEQHHRQPKDLEQKAKLAVAQPYLEQDPTVREWTGQFVPTRQGASRYLHNLFPSAMWVGRYNFRWLLGDAIAGELSSLMFPLYTQHSSLAAYG
jgi:hypothetical protein